MERESKENEKKENVVTREELFITSKVWNDMYGEGQVEQACRQSLQDLGLDYWICIWYTGRFPIIMRRGAMEMREIRIPDRLMPENTCQSGDNVSGWWNRDWCAISECPI